VGKATFHTAATDCIFSIKKKGGGEKANGDSGTYKVKKTNIKGVGHYSPLQGEVGNT
jgi:hypothetical protein